MATEQLSERVSRLEGGYEHVATKAGVVETKTNIAGSPDNLDRFRRDFNTRFVELEARLDQMENRITLRLGTLYFAVSCALFAALRIF